MFFAKRAITPFRWNSRDISREKREKSPLWSSPISNWRYTGATCYPPDADDHSALLLNEFLDEVDKQPCPASPSAVGSRVDRHHNRGPNPENFVVRGHFSSNTDS